MACIGVAWSGQRTCFMYEATQSKLNHCLVVLRGTLSLTKTSKLDDSKLIWLPVTGSEVSSSSKGQRPGSREEDMASSQQS